MVTLIIIDFQKDFIKGTLKVPGAENAEKAIIDYIIKNHDNISDIVFTVDWHSTKHCSFKRNGGVWPEHCVQFSEGAGISDNLIKVCMDYNLNIKVFKKGSVDDEEEYGAFAYIGNYGFTNGNIDIIVNNLAHKNTLHFDTKDVVVCGLAGDYCVKESITNLMKYNGPEKFNISVLKEGVVSIDDGTTFNDFVNKNDLKCV